MTRKWPGSNIVSALTSRTSSAQRAATGKLSADLHRRLATTEGPELFTRLERDLTAVMPEGHAGAVLCPLCLASFRREDLEGSDPPLTVEHIIPEKLGGARTTLTCKRCNNTHGSAIEAHLVRRIRSHNALAGYPNKVPIRGKLDCEGRPVGISFHMVPSENGDMVRNIQVKGGSPELLKRFGERLASGDLREITFTLSFDYIEERSRLAMIRIAYLLMFAEHGYAYVLGEGPSVIRKILSGEMPSREHEIERIADQLT
jgi:HNH endonuclease